MTPYILFEMFILLSSIIQRQGYVSNTLWIGVFSSRYLKGLYCDKWGIGQEALSGFDASRVEEG